MISGFARGTQVLNDSNLGQRATQAAEFLYKHMYNGETGVLLRSSYAGQGEEGVSQM